MPLFSFEHFALLANVFHDLYIYFLRSLELFNPFELLFQATFIPPTNKRPPRDFDIRLPLLRIPSLALIEVVRCLNPIDLYLLSQCSKRASSIIPLSGSKNFKFRIHTFLNKNAQSIFINENYDFSVVRKTGDYRPSCFQVPALKRCVVEYSPWRTISFVYPENDFKNLVTIVHHLQSIFKCPITTFEYFDFTKECSKDWFPMFRDIMKSQKKPLERMKLRVRFKHDQLNWITRNVKVTDYLEIGTKYPIPLGNDFTTECRKLCVRSNHLINIQNLLTLKSCTSIRLHLPLLSLRDVDVFMREWKKGSFPKLVFMSIYSRRFKDSHPILGHRKSDLGLVNGAGRIKEIDHPNEYEFFGGVEIQADDGTKAIMQMDRPDVFKLFVMKN